MAFFSMVTSNQQAAFACAVFVNVTSLLTTGGLLPIKLMRGPFKPLVYLSCHRYVLTGILYHFSRIPDQRFRPCMARSATLCAT